MAADPVLSRLVAQAERAAAALRSYLDGEPVEPDDDLVPPGVAEARYGISADTRVRWADREGLGVRTDKGWCLYASLVWKYRKR